TGLSRAGFGLLLGALGGIECTRRFLIAHALVRRRFLMPLEKLRVDGALRLRGNQQAEAKTLIGSRAGRGGDGGVDRLGPGHRSGGRDGLDRLVGRERNGCDSTAGSRAASRGCRTGGWRNGRDRRSRAT